MKTSSFRLIIALAAFVLMVVSLFTIEDFSLFTLSNYSLVIAPLLVIIAMLASNSYTKRKGRIED